MSGETQITFFDLVLHDPRLKDLLGKVSLHNLQTLRQVLEDNLPLVPLFQKSKMPIDFDAALKEVPHD